MSPAIIEALAAVAVVLLSLGGAAFTGYKYAENEGKLALDAYTQQVEQEKQTIRDQDAKVLNDVQTDKARKIAQYQSDLDAGNAAYALVMRQLRDVNADRSRLKAAAAAPAECRSFAAAPTQLSVPDAAVALGIAKEGDDAIRELGLCQAEYNALIVKINAAN